MLDKGPASPMFVVGQFVRVDMGSESIDNRNMLYKQQLAYSDVWLCIELTGLGMTYSSLIQRRVDRACCLVPTYLGIITTTTTEAILC
jgi:hypothetical protein